MEDTAGSLRASDELPESRILAQRVEVGIYLEPASRDVAGDLQERFETAWVPPALE
jgi:hypothetical protein